MGVTLMTIKDTSVKQPVVMLEYSGASEDWFTLSPTLIPPLTEPLFCRISNKIADISKQIDSGQMRTVEKQLIGFNGIIGTAVNHNGTHWGVLFLDESGRIRYYDSLASADINNNRIQLLAKLV